MTISPTNTSLTQTIENLVASIPVELPVISPPRSVPASASEVAKLIDHTLLAPSSTLDQIRDVCKQAKALGAATVCVNSSMIPIVTSELAGTDVKPISVVGFPFGSAVTESKVHETLIACRDGAREIDMVQNIGFLKSREYLQVYTDIFEVVNAAKRSPTNAIVKVIIEASLLTRDEIIASTYLSSLAGAAFVKTSTGYGGGGAKAEDVRLMYEVANKPNLGWDVSPLIKASGGIRTLGVVKTMVENGASRVGASGTQAIINEVTDTQSDRTASAGY